MRRARAAARAASGTLDASREGSRAEGGGSAAAGPEAAVLVEGLSYDYKGRRAIDGIDFSVAPGEVFGLLGPNGSGKTTLFRILATLFRPGSGRALVFGSDVARDPHAVRSRIGVVFQSPSVDAKLSVTENLRHQGHLYGLHGAELSRRIGELLGRAGLSDRAGERVEKLSGGLRRRVEIAKCLLHRPRLMLLDEPSVGLDPGARRDMWAQLLELRDREGTTLLVTTHLLDEAERCDRLVIMDKGRIVAGGRPDALKETIGGDVITIGTKDPESLARAVRERFGVEARVVNGTVRIERAGAHAWIADLAAAFAGRIDSVTVAKPTLEDVFVRRTGRAMWDGAGAPEGESPA